MDDSSTASGQKAGLDFGEEPVLFRGLNILSCLDYNLVAGRGSLGRLKETLRSTYDVSSPKFVNPIKILPVTRSDSRDAKAHRSATCMHYSIYELELTYT
jgi:hypothetical protein